MYEEVCLKYDVMMVGEGIGVKLYNSLEYVDESCREFNMFYYFDYVIINYGLGGKYDLVDWKFSIFK